MLFGDVIKKQAELEPSLQGYYLKYEALKTWINKGAKPDADDKDRVAADVGFFKRLRSDLTTVSMFISTSHSSLVTRADRVNDLIRLQVREKQ